MKQTVQGAVSGIPGDRDSSGASAALPGFFERLRPAAREELMSLLSSADYPSGAFLFFEQHPAAGAYLIVEGKVKLSVSSRRGKTLILRIAKPGELLGVAPVVLGRPCEATAQTLRKCRIAFVPRQGFLRFMKRNPGALPGIVQQLAVDYQQLFERLRLAGLGASNGEKLVRLLLQWSSAADGMTGDGEIHLPLTHSEIGELIGCSRETVTRTLTELRRRGVLSIEGDTVKIHSRPALENLLTTPVRPLAPSFST